MVCVGSTSSGPKVRTSVEYKLLQLLQYLGGEALRVIEILGHFATAFLYRITGKEIWW